GEAWWMRDRARVRTAARPVRSALPGIQQGRDAGGGRPAHREPRCLRVPAADGGGVPVGRGVSRSDGGGGGVPRQRRASAGVRDGLCLPRREVEFPAVTWLEEQLHLLAGARALLPY